MKTLQITPPNYYFPSKYFSICLLILIYLCTFLNPINAQSNVNKKDLSGYLALANFRAGIEVSKFNSMKDNMVSGAQSNSATEHGFNFLGDALLFKKKLAISSGFGFQQSKITLSQNDFLVSQKNGSKEFDGINSDEGNYIRDNRMYFSVPVRVKWRSNLIGRNKKMFIGSGVNYYKLLSQDAVVAFENNGVMTDQGLVVEVDPQSQKLDFETQVGMELSLSSTLVLNAALVYSKGLISPYEGSNLYLNNFGISTGVTF